MGLPLYLAMTQQEIDGSPLPERMAYMACHFAPYGSGLCHIPKSLPPGSILILDDRVPLWQHDPEQVAWQLADAAEQLECSHILLDLQRPYDPHMCKILQAIALSLSCPIGVSETYAMETDFAVFLSAPKANKPLVDSLAPWKGRTIWLEAAVESRIITVTKDGAQIQDCPLVTMEAPIHKDARLCCSYHIDVTSHHARFTVSRTPKDIERLLADGESAGAELAVGLYQQLG